MFEPTPEDLAACRRVAEDFSRAVEANPSHGSLHPWQRVMRVLPALLDAAEQCKEVTSACRRHGFADNPFSSNPLECFPSAWVEQQARELERLRAAVTRVVEGPGPAFESVQHMCGKDPTPEDYFQLGAGAVVMLFAALLQQKPEGE